MTRPIAIQLLSAFLFLEAVAVADLVLPGEDRKDPVREIASTVAGAPALLAARARVAAARERQGSAGRYPDPTVEGMASRKETMEGAVSMWEMNVRQPIPRAGERAADRDRADAAVAMAEGEYYAMAGEMAAEASMALNEAETAQAREKVVSDQLVRMQNVLGLVDVRIAAGKGNMAERLALQTRIASMQLMIERERRMAVDALAEVRARFGLGNADTIPNFGAPLAEEIDPEHSSSIVLARARKSEAQAMARMARASAKPMTSIGLRFERERERMGDNDTVGVAFMTEIPWRGRRYARADERAAKAGEAAAASDEAAVRFRVAALLGRVERAERFASSALRVAKETHVRLEAEYETLVRAAGTGEMGGGSTVLMLLEVLEKNTETSLQALDAESAARTARAELWRYAPPRIFQIP